jgi:hypothetical protein
MTRRCRSQGQDGPMAYLDDHYREMAKWTHHRLDTARLRAEGEQRRALADSTNHCSATRQLIAMDSNADSNGTQYGRVHRRPLVF